MATTYQTSVCHPVPNLEPSDELISAATHAWGILYAQPNKTMNLMDYVAELKDEYTKSDFVDAVIEHMERNDWITVWQADDEDVFWISVLEDTSEEESDED